MNKKDFLKELAYHLRKIPQHDRKEILTDFEEHFLLGLTDDKSEEEVADELGSPRTIARDLLADYQEKPVELETPSTNISRAVIATIGLILVNLIFVLGPVTGIFGVYVSFAVVGIVFALSPLAWIFSIVIGQAADLLGEFFIVLTLCSFGVLLSIGMIYVGKFFYRILVRYIKLNVRIIKG